MKKFSWAMWVLFLILSAYQPASILAQSKKDLLIESFNEAMGLQDSISLLSGDVVQPLNKPLHWKVSGVRGGLTLEKGGNLSVPGIAWYQVSSSSGYKFLWTPDRSFGQIFTPAGNFMLKACSEGFILCADTRIQKLNQKALLECREELKNFKKQ